MKALKKIDASFTSIEKLPDSITHLNQLVKLNVHCCSKLTKLPQQLGEMKGLKKLYAGRSAIKQLPQSITQLKGLVKLNLYKCKNLRQLPEDIGNLKGLEIFSAGNTAIEQLPDSFGGLISLVELYLTKCKKLRNLPNSIWKLKLLKQLYLNECFNLEQLPEQLGKMQCLERLYASFTAIEQIPDSIGLLSRLRVLDFQDCKNLKYVPESLWNLTSIEDLTLHLGKTGEISLPDMKKLSELHLSCNVGLCLPMIQCFSSLESLTLTDEGQILSSAKPFSLSKLFNLQHLTLYNCTSLGSYLPELPLNLEELSIYNHTSLEKLPDLSSLRKLETLHIGGCISLQSISALPFHLRILSVTESTSLQDLSMLKESVELGFLQVGQPDLPFEADLPNREVAEWFDYKSSGHTVSFDVPPIFGSNCLIRLPVKYQQVLSVNYFVV